MTPCRARVYLTQTPYAAQAWGGDGLRRRFREQYEAGTRQPFRLVASAAEADLIVYCEEYQESEGTFAPKLRAERLVAEFPERVFVLSSEDRPLGFLSGIYASMPHSRFNHGRFRSGGYFGEINPLIAQAEHERPDRAPRLLFSFIGARTSRVRATLLKHFASTERWTVRETGNTQFNIGVDDPAKREGQLAYLGTILNSAFVLCPRGFGTSSFRLFETMRLGRAPVILADEWVPPCGPAWPNCSIRVAEHQVAHLPDLLAARAHEADELGRRAREEWERWFAPAVYASRCLEWIHDLQLARHHNESEAFSRWPEVIRQAQMDRVHGGRLRRTLRRLQLRCPLSRHYVPTRAPHSRQ